MNIKMNMLNAFQGLMSNRLRAALSSLGIIIGVFSVVLLLALGDGVQRSILQRIESLGSNLLFVFPGGGQTDVLGNRGGRNQIDVLTKDLAAKIQKEVGNVGDVSPEITAKKIAINGQKNMSLTVYGVMPQYQTVRNSHVQYGEFINSNQESAKDKVIVLGTKVVETLFGNSNPLGKSVRIDDQIYTVIGVMENKDQQGFADPNKSAYMPLSTALTRMIGTQYVSSIAVSVTSKDLIDQVKENLNSFLMRNFAITDPAEANFTILSQQDILNTVQQITNILKAFLAAIAVISLVVGGIGIMNIMLVSVTERTREIGIRKCIGAHRGDILVQFLAESVYLTLFGGIIGILLSYAVVLIVGNFGVDAIISTSAVTLALGFSVSVGIIFGLLPAYRASRLNPIEALRYE